MGAKQSNGTNVGLSKHLDLSHFSSTDELFFEMSRRSSLQQYQIRRLAVRFRHLSTLHQPQLRQALSVAHLSSLYMDSDRFIMAFFSDYESAVLGLKPYREWFRHVFTIFDGDRDGKVGFLDFGMAISRGCSSKEEERMGFLFDLFNVRKDGLLDREELEVMLLVTSKFVTLASEDWRKQLSLSEALDENIAGSFVAECSKIVFAALPEASSRMTLADFAVWVKAHVDTESFLKRFEMLPTREEERDSVRALEAKSEPKEGETWFVLSAKWWRGWKEYVSYDQDGSSDPWRAPPDEPSRLTRSPSVFSTLRPIAIDNGELQGPGDDLQPNLVENEDYILVNERMWHELHDLYGGGPVYPRKAVLVGNPDTQQFVRVELYPFTLTFYPVGMNGEIVSEKGQRRQVSCQTRLADLRDLAKNLLLPEKERDQPVRLWIQDAGDWALLEPGEDSCTLEQLSFRSGDHLALETRVVPPKGFKPQAPVTVAPRSPAAAASPENGADSPHQESTTQPNGSTTPVPETGTTNSDSNSTSSAPVAPAENGKSKEPETTPTGASGAAATAAAAAATSFNDGKVWARELRKIEVFDPKLLKVGDRLDARDSHNTWFRSTVAAIKGTGDSADLFISFDGWSQQWNEWINVQRVCKCPGKSLTCNCGGSLAKLETYSIRRDHMTYGEPRGGNVEAPSIRGVAGLSNLGNTCYMNSTLQCLSNTPIANSYFVSDRYVADINRNNPLGNGGALAREFASLLKHLWSGKYSSVAPREFRKALTRFAPQFSGNNQHDSQELLAYLLDGLHEDLNRVKKKVQTSPVEANGRDDEVVAKEAWETYQKRNLSVIVDLFMGQLKSTVICPDEKCRKVSVTFDPFMYLQVPVPSISERRIPVVVVTSSPERPQALTCRVPSFGTITDLKTYICDAVGIKNGILVTEVYRGRVVRVLGPEKAVATIGSRDAIYVYEETVTALGEDEGSPSEWIQAMYRYTKKTERGVARDLFGAPVVLTVDPKWTNRVLHKYVAKGLAKWVSKGSKIPPWRLLITDLTGARCGVCSSDRNCYGCEIPENEEECRVFKESGLVLSWDGNNAETWDFLTQLNKLCDISSLQPHPASNDSNRKDDITLMNCLEKFSQTEVLGEMDAWYCPNCKTHRRASKKLDIFRCPEILIIQLKRFQHLGNNFREKITAFVDFPVKELDISRFVVRRVGPEVEPLPVYDLYAISNHHGGVSGGHYTSFARNFENGKWYSFDDSIATEVNVSKIKTQAAYVLFYRRRH